MKATLIKSEDSYILKDGLNHVLGIDDKKLKDRLECPYLLSKQNCDEIFGVVDVEEIADIHTFGQRNHEWKAYIAGFNKAMELYQPTEIDVEIEIEVADLAFYENGERYPIEANIPERFRYKPKLDSQGCLILKKI